jgi:hypothetical protein
MRETNAAVQIEWLTELVTRWERSLPEPAVKKAVKVTAASASIPQPILIMREVMLFFPCGFVLRPGHWPHLYIRLYRLNRRNAESRESVDRYCGGGSWRFPLR